MAPEHCHAACFGLPCNTQECFWHWATFTCAITPMRIIYWMALYTLCMGVRLIHVLYTVKYGSTEWYILSFQT
jgi:hypothetical protein